MPDSNLSQTLYTTAEDYLSLGYSVIPIWGDADPARPKVAGVEWGIFQRRRTTPTEIQKWFLEDGFGGIAIVTGSISRLVVLDFDTPEGFREFSVQYPDLIETQVIQTRRGYHIYFHLLPHLNLSSRKGHGIDLLVNGRYVVARPTCIDGHSYKLMRGGQPKTLTQNDVKRITRFVDDHGSIRAVSAPQPEITPPLLDTESIRPVNTVKSVLKTLADLKRTYREWIEKGRGRNEALFQASLKARDDGWAAEQVIAALADMHVWQPVGGQHRSETPAQRYQETRKTVQSAFSRPPQPLASDDKKQTIPTSVRECLFKVGETRVVRLLDGLRLKGIKPGDTFTIQQALELLSGIVGRDSIYMALKALTPIGDPIFKRQNPFPLNPLSQANAARNTKTKKTINFKCKIDRAKKSGISPNHRPAIIYIMPSNDELCRWFGVKPIRSDPLSLDDLASAKKTRMATQRELIRRRPGHYPRRWLARRLGVSCKTLDTYNDEIEGLHSRPCFWEQPVYWSNLNSIPARNEVTGAVLEDDTGKRYPALRQIAVRLLGQGKRVTYKRQEVNYYWYGDEEASKSPHETVILNQLKPQQLQVAQKMRQPIKPPPATKAVSKATVPTSTAIPIVTHSPSLNLEPPIPQNAKFEAKKLSKRDLQKPLKNGEMEDIAQQIYTTINALNGDKSKHISQATSRELAVMYRPEQIAYTLRLVQKRRNIDNPTGFLVTVLRSESKAKQLQQR